MILEQEEHEDWFAQNCVNAFWTLWRLLAEPLATVVGDLDTVRIPN